MTTDFDKIEFFIVDYFYHDLNELSVDPTQCTYFIYCDNKWEKVDAKNFEFQVYLKENFIEDVNNIQEKYIKFRRKVNFYPLAT